jgi:hypothetical protein
MDVSTDLEIITYLISESQKSGRVEVELRIRTRP